MIFIVGVATWLRIGRLRNVVRFSAEVPGTTTWPSAWTYRRGQTVEMYVPAPPIRHHGVHRKNSSKFSSRSCGILAYRLQ